MVVFGIDRLDQLQQLMAVQPAVELGPLVDHPLPPIMEHAAIGLAVARAEEFLEALALEPHPIGLGAALGRIEIGPRHLGLAGP